MESEPLTLACNYNHNEMQKCKCLCACSSLLLWAAAASVLDDRCHTGGGRQNGDMWEWEQAVKQNWGKYATHPHKSKSHNCPS